MIAFGIELSQDEAQIHRIYSLKLLAAETKKPAAAGFKSMGPYLVPKILSPASPKPGTI